MFFPPKFFLPRKIFLFQNTNKKKWREKVNFANERGPSRNNLKMTIPIQTFPPIKNRVIWHEENDENRTLFVVLTTHDEKQQISLLFCHKTLKIRINENTLELRTWKIDFDLII
jgi:hypothetical protein